MLLRTSTVMCSQNQKDYFCFLKNGVISKYSLQPSLKQLLQILTSFVSTKWSRHNLLFTDVEKLLVSVIGVLENSLLLRCAGDDSYSGTHTAQYSIFLLFLRSLQTRGLSHLIQHYKITTGLCCPHGGSIQCVCIWKLGMKEGAVSGGILPGAAATGSDSISALPPASPVSARVAAHSSSTHTAPHEHSSSSPLHGCFLCLLSFLLSVVMSAKKATSTASNKTGSANTPSAIQANTPRVPQIKRARSVSMSVDLECPRRNFKNKAKPVSCQGNNGSVPSESSKSLVNRLRPRLKHVSLCEGAERFLSQCVAEDNVDGYVDPNDFPFQLLPKDCQLKVFSYLSHRERGVCAQVCTDWESLMRSSSLWTVVDLTIFPHCHTATHDCTHECYTSYRDRTKKYLEYLQTVRPALKRFSFSYDIGDCEDRWLDAIESLLKCCRLQELSHVRLNWRETPKKPIWTESHTWSTADGKQFHFRNKYRQRTFVNFFEKFTAAAPNITQLTLPFDWSCRSLEALGRLGSLHSLVLEKYFSYQGLQQEYLDQLLTRCTSLRRLVLEVWTANAQGVELYDMTSQNLTYLDVSQCRGFYLDSVNLPNVTVFKMNRYPWNGHLVCPDRVNIRCVYDVLCTGTPSLKQLNEHTLHSDWKYCVYPELETVLRAVCSCQKHKSSW